MRNVSRYIDKLEGEDLADALCFSLFRLSNTELQEALETIPESERTRLFGFLNKAIAAERTRDAYAKACRESLAKQKQEGGRP